VPYNLPRINFTFVLKTASWQSQQVPVQRIDKIEQNDIEQTSADKGTQAFRHVNIDIIAKHFGMFFLIIFLRRVSNFYSLSVGKNIRKKSFIILCTRFWFVENVLV